MFVTSIAWTWSNNTYLWSSAWSNPWNITWEDWVYTAVWVNASSRYSNLLVWSNFWFSIPSWATIDWIVMTYKWRSFSNSKIRDEYCYLVNPDWSISTIVDKATKSTQISSVETTYTKWWATDTWGKTWSSSDINNSNFWFALWVYYYPWTWSATTIIDSIKCTIYYTPQTNDSKFFLLF